MFMSDGVRPPQPDGIPAAAQVPVQSMADTGCPDGG